MTISSENNQISYTGNGTTTAFSFPYAFQDEGDLVVIETVIATGVQTTKTLTTDYTVSGTADDQGFFPDGGTVTAVIAPASTVTWTIFNDPDATQTLDLVENDPLPAESLEAALDRLTMIAQRLKKVVQRSLRQPTGDTTDIDTLPAKVDRASKYLAFDSDGNPIASEGTSDATVISSFMATVLDDTTAADARTTLGAAASATTITAGTGLSGGGTLAANRTIAADIASQAEAEAGTAAVVLMTPERTKQAVQKIAVVKQIVTGTIAAGSTTTTTPARDDTTPLSTEGTEVFSQAITVQTGTKVKVEIDLTVATSAAGNLSDTVWALFRGTTCIKVIPPRIAGGGTIGDHLNIMHVDTHGTSGAVTYSLRAGTDSGNTLYWGQTQTAGFNSLLASQSYLLTEIG